MSCIDPLAPVPLRLALLSDIHAYSSGAKDSPPSFVSVSAAPGEILTNPFAALDRLVESQELTAEILLCAGDMGDRADQVAQAHVWSRLRDLKTALGAQDLFAVPGNHDLDSRYKYNDYDAKGAIQALSPMFPGATEAECDRFWSRNFVIISRDYWGILLLNSAAYHGSGKRAEKEREHGRISLHTISAIERQLSRESPKPINLLLCHHHPLRNDEITIADYSEMEAGDVLINKLGSGEFGDWLVIHGHKHFPRIWRAGGSASAPMIFSLGSFSARLWAEIATAVRNQFYILELPTAEILRTGTGIFGNVLAWDWVFGQGWRPAQAESKIPHRAGFGCRRHPREAATMVSNLVREVGGSWITWQEVCSRHGELRYMAPPDLALLWKYLSEEHRVRVTHDDHGSPEQLSVAQ